MAKRRSVRGVRKRITKQYVGGALLRRKRKRRSRKQSGGIFPLAALIPSLIAGGKPPLWELLEVQQGSVPTKPWKLPHVGGDKKISYHSSTIHKDEVVTSTTSLPG